MTVQLKTYDTGGTLLTALTLPPAPVGGAGAAYSFRLQNDGTSPATAVRVRMVVQDDNDEYVARGERPVDERWGQLKALDTGTTTGQVETAWTPTGRGAWLSLADIGVGEYVDLQARQVLPGTAPVVTVDYALDWHAGSGYEALDAGHDESGARGLVSVVGRESVTQPLLGAPITESSPEAATVEVPDYVWEHGGVLNARLKSTESLNDQDGSAQTLGAGEAYYARYSLGAGLTVTKGDKDSASAPPAVPDVPDGEIDLGYVLRDDSGTISAADVTSDPVVGGFEHEVDGTAFIVGPGRVLVGNAYVDLPAATSTTPALSTSHWCWLTEEATVALTQDGSRPTPRAKLLWTFDTDGSGPDASTVVDHRGLPLGVELVELLVAAGDGSVSRWVNSTRHRLFIYPPDLALWADQAGSGNTTGELTVEVAVDATTIFTSSGSDDRRLGLTVNAGEDTQASRGGTDLCIPEVLPVDPWSVIEVTVSVGTAFDGTAPVDLHISIPMVRS